MSSQAQIAANRLNSQASTGPSTEAGKAKSSLNAVKTGLTGRTVLLPAEDVAAYQHHVQRFIDEHQPCGATEQTLVQSIADTEWRLLRIPSLESGIYALGRIQFAQDFAAEDPAVRDSLIQAHTFLTFRRDLSNLATQERRLHAYLAQNLKELASLQASRRQSMARKLNEAAVAYLQSQPGGAPFKLDQFGFEFTIEQVQSAAASLTEKNAPPSPSSPAARKPVNGELYKKAA
jgi:hypothetical protein